MARNFLKDYFGFNKQQRNGLLVLLFICLVLLLVRLVYPAFIVPEPMLVQDLPLVERQLDSALAVKEAVKTDRREQETAPQPANAPLFEFDPNAVSREQLLQLGFKPKTAKALLKFRKKGFRFRTKSDLQKVYGVSDKLFAKLEPYIVIPEAAKAPPQEGRPASANKPSPKKLPLKVELNSADSLGLVALDGIGPAFAKRILKYRQALGGFVALEQLKEVYGFSEEMYEQVKQQFTVEPATVKKIRLNHDDFKTINKHPYLSYELTKSICNMRRRNTIDKPLLKGLVGEEALCQKLLPYVDFD